MGAGEDCGAETVMSTPLKFCRAETVTGPGALTGVGVPVFVEGVGGEELLLPPPGDAAVPPQPTSDTRNKRRIADFTAVNSCPICKKMNTGGNRVATSKATRC